MSRHQQEVESAAPPGFPAGYGNSDFPFGATLRAARARLFLCFIFYLRHLTGSWTHRGWLELGNPWGHVDNASPDGLTSPQNPPHINWVKPVLPACAGAAKRAAAAKSRAENCH